MSNTSGVTPYDPPPSKRRQRALSGSRLDRGLRAVEVGAKEVGVAAREVEKAARFGRGVEELYDEEFGRGTVRSSGKTRRTTDGNPSLRSSSVSQENGSSGDDEKRGAGSTRDDGRSARERSSQVSQRSRSARTKKPSFLKKIDQFEDREDFKAVLAETQEMADDIQDGVEAISHRRQQLVNPPSNSFRAVDLHDLQYLASLIATTSRQIPLTYKTLRGINRQFGIAIGQSGERRTDLNSSDRKDLTKQVAELNAAFADALDDVEEFSRKEKKEVQSGVCEQRVEAVIRTEEPALDNTQVLRRLKSVKSSSTKSLADVASMDLSLYEARWALENPFSEINRAIRKIKKYSTGITSSDPVPLSKQSSKGSSRSRKSRKEERFFELGDGKASRSAGEDTESQQLLGPDGKPLVLPYHIPTDDPNDSETPSELLEDARAKVRSEHIFVPLLVLFWIGVFSLVIYWGVSKLLGNDNLLGDVDLGDHLKNDAWNDTATDAAASTTSTFSSDAVGLLTSSSSGGVEGPTSNAFLPSQTTGR